MLEAVVIDGGRTSVAELARTIGVPVSTGHRQIATLLAGGYLVSTQAGRLVAGPRLLALANRLDEKQIITSIAAPVLGRLARELGTIVQLGTLEGDMVTYRVKTGEGAAGLFTKVGMQLEAYCSAVGKALLAHLPEAERDTYLAGGPFVALTQNTITNPRDLLRELVLIRDRGWAFDDGEIADDLVCIAVPIRFPFERVPAAISATFDDRQQPDRTRALPSLQAAAEKIASAFRSDYG